MSDFKPLRTEDTGVVDAAQRRRLGGFEMLSRISRGELPGPPMAAVMRLRVVEVERGRVLFQGAPHAGLLNTIGTVHAGFAMTLLDSCMACAVHSTLDPGQAYTTVETKVNFVRALRPDAGVLDAEGKVVHPGRTVATAEGRITDADGRLYAHGTTTCYVFAAKD